MNVYGTKQIRNVVLTGTWRGRKDDGSRSHGACDRRDEENGKGSGRNNYQRL